MRVAILGGGIAGLAAARRLIDAGVAPVVFEKARGPGGRAASKRFGTGAVDLGAQYFTARDPVFRREVARWCRNGVAARWRVVPTVHPASEGRRAPSVHRYVPLPRMGALGHHLAAGVELRSGERITAVERLAADRVRLHRDTGGPPVTVDRLIVTLPAPQVRALYRPAHADVAAAVEAAGYSSCWALGVRLPGGRGWLPDACFINEGPLRWLAANAAKPGDREPPDAWTVHATGEWSAAHLEAENDWVAAALWQAVRRIWPGLPATPEQTVAHRWRYAQVERPLGRGFLADAPAPVVLAGDWVGDGRLEGAWLSGYAAAGHLLGSV